MINVVFTLQKRPLSAGRLLIFGHDLFRKLAVLAQEQSRCCPRHQQDDGERKSWLSEVIGMEAKVMTGIAH